MTLEKKEHFWAFLAGLLFVPQKIRTEWFCPWSSRSLASHMLCQYCFVMFWNVFLFSSINREKLPFLRYSLNLGHSNMSGKHGNFRPGSQQIIKAAKHVLRNVNFLMEAFSLDPWCLAEGRSLFLDTHPLPPSPLACHLSTQEIPVKIL